MWQAVWAPYGVIIPHRSAWSHLPGLGTVIRAGYLWAVVWAISHAAGHPLPLPPAEVIRWTLAAWTMQDLIHLALDGWGIRW